MEYSGSLETSCIVVRKTYVDNFITINCKEVLSEIKQYILK